MPDKTYDPETSSCTPHARELDCNSSNKDKSLLKSGVNFIQTSALYHGGTHGIKSKFFKNTQKSSLPSKFYYLAKRDSYHEYFAFEILNAIGFATPKARLIQSDSKNNDENCRPNIHIVAKEIENYIPLQAYVDWWPRNIFFKQTLEVRIAQRSYYNRRRQVMSNWEGKHHKISGNIFAADIGAQLIQDSDMSAKGTSIGLVKEGDRYYAYFINKEYATFRKEQHYQELAIAGIDLPWLFSYKAKDQALAIIHNIKKLISKDINGHSTLENIFFNDRTASLYNYYLKKMVATKAIDAVESYMCSTFTITKDSLDRTDDSFYTLFFFKHLFFFDKFTETIQYLMMEFEAKKTHSFEIAQGNFNGWPLSDELSKEIKSLIQNKFGLLDMTPEAKLNNSLNIIDYLKKLETIPKQIITEYILSSKYSKLTTSEILESMIGKCILKDNIDYTINVNKIINKKLVLRKFTFQINMPIEQFISNYFVLLYENPEAGYINDTNHRVAVPFDPVIMYNNILHNAICIIDDTLAKNPAALTQFEERESYRINIAHKVMTKLGNDGILKQSTFNNIVEDLRGPYYQDFFENKKEISEKDTTNFNLINKLYMDNTLQSITAEDTPTIVKPFK